MVATALVGITVNRTHAFTTRAKPLGTVVTTANGLLTKTADRTNHLGLRAVSPVRIAIDTLSSLTPSAMLAKMSGTWPSIVTC